ncbi:MAG: hypothetical protein ACO26G_06755, partial [Rickettsiales bacterium]
KENEKKINEDENNSNNFLKDQIDINLGKNVKLNLSPKIQEKILEKAQDVLKDFDFNFQLYDNTDTREFTKNFLQTWKEEIGVDTLQNSFFNLLTPNFKIKLGEDHAIKSIEIDLYRIKNDLGNDEAGVLFKFQI